MTTSQRVALVTGGAGGIGRAICRTLTEAGFSVAVCDLAESDVAAVAKEVGGLAVELDVRRPESVLAAVAQIEDSHAGVDVLVNCAGVDDLRPFHETTEDLQANLIEINFGGPLRLTRRVVPHMLATGWGRVINIASDAGRLGGALEVIYSGAKGGLIAATKALAREYATAGITVNCVCPGPTDTPLLHQVADAGEASEREIRRMIKAIPMRRLGSGQDIAGAVAYFASEDAGFVTGQTISVSGGLAMV